MQTECVSTIHVGFGLSRLLFKMDTFEAVNNTNSVFCSYFIFQIIFTFRPGYFCTTLVRATYSNVKRVCMMCVSYLSPFEMGFSTVIH